MMTLRSYEEDKEDQANGWEYWSLVLSSFNEASSEWWSKWWTVIIDHGRLRLLQVEGTLDALNQETLI
jgi:hypothetical protein